MASTQHQQQQQQRYSSTASAKASSAMMTGGVYGGRSRAANHGPSFSSAAADVTGSSTQMMMDDVQLEVRRLFLNNAVDEVMAYNNKIRSEIERNNEDLRDVVGKRYRDLLTVCDEVIGMEEVCKDILELQSSVVASASSSARISVGSAASPPAGGTAADGHTDRKSLEKQQRARVRKIVAKLRLALFAVQQKCAAFEALLSQDSLLFQASALYVEIHTCLANMCAFVDEELRSMGDADGSRYPGATPTSAASPATSSPLLSSAPGAQWVRHRERTHKGSNESRAALDGILRQATSQLAFLEMHRSSLTEALEMLLLKRAVVHMQQTTRTRSPETLSNAPDSERDAAAAGGEVRFNFTKIKVGATFASLSATPFRAAEPEADDAARLNASPNSPNPTSTPLASPGSTAAAERVVAETMALYANVLDAIALLEPSRDATQSVKHLSDMHTRVLSNMPNRLLQLLMRNNSEARGVNGSGTATASSHSGNGLARSSSSSAPPDYQHPTYAVACEVATHIANVLADGGSASAFASPTLGSMSHERADALVSAYVSHCVQAAQALSLQFLLFLEALAEVNVALSRSPPQRSSSAAPPHTVLFDPKFASSSLAAPAVWSALRENDVFLQQRNEDRGMQQKSWQDEEEGGTSAVPLQLNSSAQRIASARTSQTSLASAAVVDAAPLPQQHRSGDSHRNAASRGLLPLPSKAYFDQLTVVLCGEQELDCSDTSDILFVPSGHDSAECDTIARILISGGFREVFSNSGASSGSGQANAVGATVGQQYVHLVEAMCKLVLRDVLTAGKMESDLYSQYVQFHLLPPSFLEEPDIHKTTHYRFAEPNTIQMLVTCVTTVKESVQIAVTHVVQKSLEDAKTLVATAIQEAVNAGKEATASPATLHSLLDFHSATDANMDKKNALQELLSHRAVRHAPFALKPPVHASVRSTFQQNQSITAAAVPGSDDRAQTADNPRALHDSYVIVQLFSTLAARDRNLPGKRGRGTSSVSRQHQQQQSQNDSQSDRIHSAAQLTSRVLNILFDASTQQRKGTDSHFMSQKQQEEASSFAGSGSSGGSIFHAVRKVSQVSHVSTQCTSGSQLSQSLLLQWLQEVCVTLAELCEKCSSTLQSSAPFLDQQQQQQQSAPEGGSSLSDVRISLVGECTTLWHAAGIVEPLLALVERLWHAYTRSSSSISPKPGSRTSLPSSTVVASEVSQLRSRFTDLYMRCFTPWLTSVKCLWREATQGIYRNILELCGNGSRIGVGSGAHAPSSATPFSDAAKNGGGAARSALVVLSSGTLYRTYFENDWVTHVVRNDATRLGDVEEPASKEPTVVAPRGCTPAVLDLLFQAQSRLMEIARVDSYRTLLIQHFQSAVVDEMVDAASSVVREAEQAARTRACTIPEEFFIQLVCDLLFVACTSSSLVDLAADAPSLAVKPQPGTQSSTTAVEPLLRCILSNRVHYLGTGNRTATMDAHVPVTALKQLAQKISALLRRIIDDHVDVVTWSLLESYLYDAVSSTYSSTKLALGNGSYSSASLASGANAASTTAGKRVVPNPTFSLLTEVERLPLLPIAIPTSWQNSAVGADGAGYASNSMSSSGRQPPVMRYSSPFGAPTGDPKYSGIPLGMAFNNTYAQAGNGVDGTAVSSSSAVAAEAGRLWNTGMRALWGNAK